MTREKETTDERADRKFHDGTKLLHGDRLVMYHLDGIRKAVNALSQNIGKGQAIQNRTLSDGLEAIALAASTPENNSKEVEELTVRLRTQREALEATRDSTNPPAE